MSRLLGTGFVAVLIAGGAEAPDVVTRKRAVRRLLHGIWLYARDGDHGVERAPVRGWRSDIYAALEELHPEAAAHLERGQDGHATWMLYGADPEMGDETT